MQAKSIGSKKTSSHHKIGLFSSITILVSAVVGIGIFFKNQTILKNNHYNGTGVLISWAIAVVIALTTALAFVEIISSDKEHKGGGLGTWARNICGHRIGRFVLVSFPITYYIFKMVNTSWFTSEGIFLIFAKVNDSGKVTLPESIDNIWWIIIVSLGILLLFLVINTLSTAVAKYFSISATVAESIPLLLIGAIGVAVATIYHPTNNFFNNIPDSHQSDYQSNIDAIGILASLPSLLFSFDSFLTIGNASSSMNNPKRDVPLSILIGMPIVSLCYLMVTVGQLITGTDNVYHFFNVVVNKFGGGDSAQSAIQVVVGVIILMCLLGSINSFALTAIRSSNNAIDNNQLAFSGWYKKITNGAKIGPGPVFCFITSFVVIAIMSLLTGFTQTDAIYDVFSSLVTLFFFLIYALVILFGTINHFNNKVQVNKSWYFAPCALISMVGIFLSVAFNYIYTFGVGTISDPTGTTNFGMFFSSNPPKWIIAIVAWSSLLLFISIPFGNDLIIKWTGNRYKQRLLWQ